MRKEIPVPSVEEFRNNVDAIGRNRNSTIIKTLYLTASRCNEFLTKICPSDVGVTRALGKLVTYEVKDFVVPNIQYKEKGAWEAYINSELCKKRYFGKKKPTKDMIRILLLKIPVLKQRKSRKNPEKKKPQKFKMCAIPCVKSFEPWYEDLSLWIGEHDDKLCFNLTRQSVLKIVKSALGYHPNHLRHIRVTHLVNNYQFTGEQVSLVTGWTMSRGFGFLGQRVSGRVNIYLHSQWTNYIEKLLIPLDLIKKDIITLNPAVAV